MIILNILTIFNCHYIIFILVFSPMLLEYVSYVANVFLKVLKYPFNYAKFKLTPEGSTASSLYSCHHSLVILSRIHE